MVTCQSFQLLIIGISVDLEKACLSSRVKLIGLLIKGEASGLTFISILQWGSEGMISTVF